MRLTVRTLAPRKETFVREYLANGFRHIDAAMVAVPTDSRASAGRIAKVWLLDVYVQRAIRELIDLRAQRQDISADNVMQDIATMGASNMQDYYDEHGNLLPVHKLSRQAAGCIREVKERESINAEGVGTITREYKLYDRLAAQEKLAKILGMFKDQADEDEKGSGRLNVNLQVNFVEAEDGRRAAVSAVETPNPSKGTGFTIEGPEQPLRGSECDN